MDPSTYGYSNFFALVTIQLGWALLIAAIFGMQKGLPMRLLAGAVAGIPLGAVFDLLIGRLSNIFRYPGFDGRSLFLLLNASLSYGIAVATVLSLPPAHLPCHRTRWAAAVPPALAILFLVVAAAKPDSWLPLLSMVLLGAILIASSEAIALWFGYRGYLSQGIAGDWKPFLRVYVFSVTTGAVYEGANHWFPVWQWVNKSPTMAANTIIIILFGYLALFYPISLYTDLYFLFQQKLSKREG